MLECLERLYVCVSDSLLNGRKFIPIIHLDQSRSIQNPEKSEIEALDKIRSNITHFLCTFVELLFLQSLQDSALPNSHNCKNSISFPNNGSMSSPIQCACYVAAITQSYMCRQLLRWVIISHFSLLQTPEQTGWGETREARIM